MVIVVVFTTTIDMTDELSRFGLTRTEAAAYLSLLRIGPSSGYAVAKDLGIARANIYPALACLDRRELIQKHAGRPQIFEALPPDACVALLAAEQAEALAALEHKLEAFDEATASVAKSFESTRTARAIADRLAGRAKAKLVADVSRPVESLLAPHARRLARQGVAVSIVATDETPLSYVMVDDQWALFWLQDGRGIWGSDPILLAIAAKIADQTERD